MTGSPPYSKRSFGQNFLIDKNVIAKIVDALDLDDMDTIVEIGAGRGALTEELVARSGGVIAIELDRDLVPVLEEKFADRTNFELLKGNALDIDFKTLRNNRSDKIKLAANLPYYISTAILQHLIDARECFSQMVLMLQREVVERITAEPGSSERGYLTVLVEAFFSVEKLFDVPPTAFRPRPKVWSSVARLVPLEEDPNFKTRDELFRSLISASFRQKRKTLLNNLKGFRSDIQDVLVRSEIDPKRRAETLTIEDWKRLTQELS
jgi:16S rRNA (adenine1518-N6/adenine1519-N6)-dimethyltransferase